MHSSELDTSLVSPEQLQLFIKKMYPSASERDIAALMAEFLEDVPAQYLLDDGALTPAPDAAWATDLSEWIAQLKQFAGDAYPSVLRRAGGA